MEEVPANTPIDATQEQVQDPASKHDVTIPVTYYLPENVPNYYSDGATILHTANEFIVSFLLTDFPLATSKEDLRQVKTLGRRCIARVLMSPAQFEILVKAMQDNLDKHFASYKKP